jgi:hypothetical protein
MRNKPNIEIMKILFLCIITALLISDAAFAGAGTLFRDDIGVSNWPFTSSALAKKNSAAKLRLKRRELNHMKPIDASPRADCLMHHTSNR